MYLSLFLGFLRVGCFSFGGAYGAIPLIRDVVLSNHWMSEDTLTYMIAVSESTPGPIMVNLATYVGSQQAGLAGAIIATAAVILPSFLIILLLTSVLKEAIKYPWIQAVLNGLQPCIIGMILATGTYMVLSSFVTWESRIEIHLAPVLITILLVVSMWGWKRITRKKMSPVTLLGYSAILGILIYGYKY